MKTLPQTEAFERCVMCGELTHVPIATPVDFRDFYEIGCGQLCVRCAKKHRKDVQRESRLTNAQILLAVEQSRKDINK